MSNPHDPIEQFAQIYSDKQNLEQRLDTASEFMADIIKQGVAQAELMLNELAANPTVQAHYITVGERIVQASIELEEVKPILESLGMQEEITIKQTEIDAMRTDPRFPAAQYLASLTGISLSLKSPVESAPIVNESRIPALIELAAPALESEVLITPQPAVETIKAESKPVKIVVDPQFNISINGRATHIGREMIVAGQKVSERDIRKARIEALRLMAGDPEKDFTIPEIAKALFPDQDYESSRDTYRFMTNYIVDFLRDSPHSSGRPLILATQVHQKLYTYRINNFEIEFEKTEKIYTPREEKVFTAESNGAELGGKGGRLLLLLNKSSREFPVRNEQAIKLYSAEELKKIKTSHGHLLSGLVSTVRPFAEEAGLIIKKVLLDRNPETGRRETAYYMEQKSVTEFTAMTKEAEPEIIEPEQIISIEQIVMPENEIEVDHELERIWPIKYAAVFTAFLSQHTEVLQKAGIDPLPEDVHNAIIELAFNSDSTNENILAEELNKLRELAVDRMQIILGDPNIVDNIIDHLTNDDPRFDLAAYLEGLKTHHWELIKNILTQHKELIITVKQPARGGVQIVDLQKRYIDIRTNDEKAHDGIDDSVISINAIRTSVGIAESAQTSIVSSVSNAEVSAKQPTAKEKQLREKVSHIAGELLDIMARANLTEGSSSMQQIVKVLNIQRNLITRLVESKVVKASKSSQRQSNFTAEQILLLGLAAKLQQDMFEAKKRDIIIDTAKECYAKFLQKNDGTHN